MMLYDCMITKEKLYGELEEKPWARVKRALACAHGQPRVCTLKHPSALQVLVSHLHSKEVKEKHSKFSTKVALTAKESRNSKYGSTSLIENLCFSSKKAMPILHSVQLYINVYIQILSGVFPKKALQVKLIHREALYLYSGST